MSRHGDDGFFSLRSRGAGPFGQEVEPFFDRRILGLETHQTPGAFDQGSAQALVTPFGHTARDAFGSTAMFSRTQTGVRTDRAPVREALPGTNLACEYCGGEFADSQRHRARSALFQLTTQKDNLLLHPRKDRAIDSPLSHTPFGQKLAQA